MKRSATYSAITVLLLSSALLTGCGEERGASDTFIEGIPTEVSLSLSSTFNSPDGVTRTDGTPADPATANEKINDWFIAFVDRNGKVAKVLTRAEAGRSGAVEQETFKCVLPSGTYTAYAFANITPAELKEAAGVEFKEDKTVDAGNIKNAVWKKEKSLNLYDITGHALPMSGVLTPMKVENTIEETFTIEVVRMAAKVEVQLKNNADETVTVKSVALDPVTNTGISLFPMGSSGISYAHLGNSAYTPLTGAEYSKLTYTPASAISLDKDKAQSCTFYIQESLSGYGNTATDSANDGAFTLFLTVSHEDGVTEIEQHNITSTVRGYINRNDWVVIPVTLSRYDISVEAIFYPPIGGYPAYLSKTDPDGAQVFTFATAGDFAIVPKVFDKQSGSYEAPANYRISIDGTVSDPSGIFEKTPTVVQTSTAIPDEILGTLNSKEGKAVLTLKVELFGKPYVEGDEPTHTYTRTIYIIRDNAAS